MPKSVLPRARAPPPLDKREARARARGSTIFETAPGQKRGQSTKMPKSVLPRAGAGAPQPRGQSTGTGQYFRDVQGSKSQKSVLPRARTPRLSRLKKPKSVLPRARGSTIFETFKAQNAEICTPPRPCPPAPAWTEHGRGGVRFSRLSTLKMPKSVLPRARAPPPPGPHRPKHGHVGVRISKLLRLKMPKSVLPRP